MCSQQFAEEAELVNTATYIINRTGVSAVEGKSPFELWFGKKPSIKHLKVIGTTCYARIPEQKRKKLDKKALKCVLIGYNSYRLWHQESGDTKISRDVRFDKGVLLKSTVSTSISLEIDELHNSSQESSSTAGEDEMKEEVRDSDEPDELVCEYRCLQTSKRWPLALIFDFIDIAGHNAFCAWSDHEPNYNVGKSHRLRLFLMQLAEYMVKLLINGRAKNPVGIQEPIPAAIRMFVPVEHRVARHIKPQENKTVGRCCLCSWSRP